MSSEVIRTYETPTRLVHGINAITSVGEEAGRLGMTRPLVVTDQEIVKAGLLDEVLAPLREAGLDPVVYDQVRANPDVGLVDAGAEFYRSERCDGPIGLGGGSAMHTATSSGAV